MSAGVAGASAWHGRRSEASEAPGEACCELQSDLLSDLLSRSSDADPPVWRMAPRWQVRPSRSMWMPFGRRPWICHPVRRHE